MPYSPKDILLVRIFHGLEPTDCLQLFEVCKRTPLSANTIILKEGEIGASLYAILQGSVRVTKGIRGELEHLATLVKGDCFGEMALLEGSIRTATVTTLEETTLLEFQMKDMFLLFKRNARIAAVVFENLARILSGRLRHFEDRVQEVSWRDDEISWDSPK